MDLGAIVDMKNRGDEKTWEMKLFFFRPNILTANYRL
jgi:hypothetical protein